MGYRRGSRVNYAHLIIERLMYRRKQPIPVISRALVTIRSLDATNGRFALSLFIRYMHICSRANNRSRAVNERGAVTGLRN